MTNKFKKFKCPKCGSEDFEGLFNTFDQTTYQCWVYKDGTYDMVMGLKDFVGETELARTTFRCMDCDYEIDIDNLPKENRCEDIWEEDKDT